MVPKMVIAVLGFLAVISLSTGAPSSLRANVVPRALFDGPQLYLTVSAVAGYRREGGETILLDRMLEVHWENFENLPNDTVGVYSENPAGKSASTLKQIVLEEHPVLEGSGMVRTSVRYDRKTLDSSSDRCLGFWIGYLQTIGDSTDVVMSNCLQIYPTWMNDIKSSIGNTPLHSLMIPGTHNAGSWIYYQGAASEGPLVEYTYCHEDNIYDQLLHGVRSLDVRVGHYGLTQEKFYINHDVIIIRPLRTLLEDVRRFVLETNEIVLLDFHRFPVGFGEIETHHKLVEFLEEHLGDILAPKALSLSVTPEQLWELKRTVVLFYSQDEIANQYPSLWHGVQQAWGDTNKMDELESHLSSAISDNGCRGRAWAAMAQMTSTAEDIIIRPSFGIRGYSNESNNEISKWYQRDQWYSRSMIVALDFYRSTNLIETSIEVNRNLAVC